MTKTSPTKTMTAAHIVSPQKASVHDVSLPSIGEHDVLIEIKQAGICGTDLHIWHGSYALANYPIIPGHEFSGVIAGLGAAVEGFQLGDRVTADPNLPCYQCYFCHRRQFNQCLRLEATGVTRAGAFAHYVAVPASSVFAIGNLSFAEAALLEPLACVVWGLQQVKIQSADSVLIFGAGPMGLLMLQAVKSAGAAQVVIVDKEIARLKLAKALGAHQTLQAGEITPELARELSPYGFDIVADATGVPKVIENTIHYARPGGKLWIFGVAPEGSTVALPPAEIFRKDLQVIGSFALNKTFTESISLVQHEAVKLMPLISHQLPLSDFEKALSLAEHDSERLKVQLQVS